MDEQLVDYLEPLKDLQSLLEHRQAILKQGEGQEDASGETIFGNTSSNDALFFCLEPLLNVLMGDTMLWFRCEDGGLRSLNRLRYTDGMIFLEFSTDSLKLTKETAE